MSEEQKKSIVTLELPQELPVGTIFKFKGSRQKYRIAEHEGGCSCCAFHYDGWSHESKENTRKLLQCRALKCSIALRKDKIGVIVVKVDQ